MPDDVRIPPPHAWSVTPTEAIAIQQELRGLVITHDDLPTINTVAGVDVGFEQDGRITRAAVAVLSFADLTLHRHAIARRPTSMPYMPGLLSFREVPAVLDALAQLDPLPDLLLVDGQGYLHPRRFGIACHLGVLTGIPAIGVGKRPFVGEHAPVPNLRGAWEPVRDAGEVIGAALRTRPNTRPLYISVGHRVSLATAIAYVLHCTPTYRLPETTRLAHRLASGQAAAKAARKVRGG